MNVAIVGATGVVGRKIIQIINERRFFADEFFLFASQKSQGTTFDILGKTYTVESLNEKNLKNKKIDIALFSAGSKVSKKFVPYFLNMGAYVVDNASYFRLTENIPLVSFGVNDDLITKETHLICNPNCSTIMLMPILNALKPFGIKRVVVNTYQACSGAGKDGIDDLLLKRACPLKFEKPIFNNCLPKIGNFTNEYSEEELKIINESRKILGLNSLAITATCVRVPVLNCHAESVNVAVCKQFSAKKLKQVIKNIPNLIVYENDYPTQLECDETDNILVGRIRKDNSLKNSFWLYLVSDNLRVGAALNAVKIAEKIKKVAIIDL